jgi:hypothetical protein
MHSELDLSVWVGKCQVAVSSMIAEFLQTCSALNEVWCHANLLYFCCTVPRISCTLDCDRTHHYLIFLDSLCNKLAYFD